ncbi:MAG: NADH-quinone oxidoreductase subunit J [Ignavibacteriae bacterium]|nr:NADH-quinone oxidoreductase subunit J [Ignavibacteriota bacterium]
MKFNLESIFLIVFSAAAVFSAIMMITRKSPISSALFLILNFFMVSGIYLLLKAQFIAIIQILVYMGAIMVLFIFVIMLLNPKDERKLSENFTYTKITAVLFSIGLLGLMSMTFYFGFETKYKELNSNAENIGKAEFLGRELFTTYSFPVIITGILLTAAVIGAVVLAKKKFE